MKSAGALTSRRLSRVILLAVSAAIPLILGWYECAFTQTPGEPLATKTWEAAAAAAAPAPSATAAEVGSAAAVPSNLVPDAAPTSIALPLPPPPRDASLYESEASPPPRDTSAPLENDPTALPDNLVTTPLDDGTQASSTVEIPPVLRAPDSAGAAPSMPPTAIQPPAAPKPDADSQQSLTEESEIARYQQEQSGSPPAQYRNLQALATEDDISTPIGLVLREERRSLKTGQEADGLLIVAVRKGSPAASAGLHAFSHGVHDAITGAAMIGSVMSGMPAAILVIPLVEYLQVGESYDLIIGMDGSRIKNFLDFEDQMRDVQPGELIYFSIVRDGKRLQISVPVPATLSQATN